MRERTVERERPGEGGAKEKKSRDQYGKRAKTHAGRVSGGGKALGVRTYVFFFFLWKNPKWVLRPSERRGCRCPSLHRGRAVRARPAGQSRAGPGHAPRRRRRRRRRPSAAPIAARTPALDPCGRGTFGARYTHAYPYDIITIATVRVYGPNARARACLSIGLNIVFHFTAAVS